MQRKQTKHLGERIARTYLGLNVVVSGDRRALTVLDRVPEDEWRAVRALHVNSVRLACDYLVFADLDLVLGLGLDHETA